MLEHFTGHPFVDHYDWKGRLLDEPDSDEPELRRHCEKCGAFLPKNPEKRTKMIPVEWEYTCDDQGEISGINIQREEPEIEEIWDCKKCGHEHDSDDMYI